MRWIVLLCTAAVAATGGISYAARRSAPATIPPPPHWGLYSPGEWRQLTRAFERRGFAPASVRLVTGTSTLRGRRSFALLAARSRSGRECFAVARGAALGAPACRIERPLTVYRWRDALLAVVRKQVDAVTMTADGRTANVELPAASDAFYAFNAAGLRRPTTLVAHRANGAPLESVTVR